MKFALTRHIAVAAATCSMALLGAGAALAAPANANLVANGDPCPDPARWPETCTVSEDGLTVTRHLPNAMITTVEYYTSQGRLICTTQSGAIGVPEVVYAPCRALVPIVRAFGSLSG